MRDDIEFELYVRQPVEHSLSQLEEAAVAFQVSEEELNRAVFGWIMKRVNRAGSVPEWVFKELDKLNREE